MMHNRFFAEIGFDDLGIVLDRSRRPFGDFHAVIEHGDAFAHTHYNAHRMLDEEDGELELFAHARDEFYEVGFFGRVHAGSRFVEQQQAWLGGEAADDFEAALLAVGGGLGGGGA